jgi:hypothetical protein
MRYFHVTQQLPAEFRLFFFCGHADVLRVASLLLISCRVAQVALFQRAAQLQRGFIPEWPRRFLMACSRRLRYDSIDCPRYGVAACAARTAKRDVGTD